MLVLAGCADGTRTVALGGVEIDVDIADEEAEWGQGLQGHESLPPGEGLLFVFDDADIRTFAMKDVSFPIDVVYIGENMQVESVWALYPGETRLVSSLGPVRYVLELPQGWAKEQGIVGGDELVLDP